MLAVPSLVAAAATTAEANDFPESLAPKIVILSGLVYEAAKYLCIALNITRNPSIADLSRTIRLLKRVIDAQFVAEYAPLITILHVSYTGSSML